MIELAVNSITEENGQRMSSTIGSISIDDADPKAEPVINNPLDGRTLAVVMKVLRDMAKDQAKARTDFGDPAA